MGTVYKIHPAIGIARLGNSDQFYLAPEQAGALPTDPVTGQPVTSFRDAQGQLLKQAARFRVFAYESDSDPGTEVQVGSGGVQGIQWTVHLANKKACWFQFEQLVGSGEGGYPAGAQLRNSGITDSAERQNLILDPGPRTVGASPLPSTQDFDLPASSPTLDPSLIKPYTITTLGSLQLDASGNLLVLGGSGNSGTTNLEPHDPGLPPKYEYVTTTYANNDGWFDDASDGPVTATLVMADGSLVPVDVPAWCICAPPRYAPQITNLVTLRDTMFDIAVRELGARPDIYSNSQFNASYEVDYDNEVAPILSRPNLYRWVVNLPPAAIQGHTGITQDQSDPSQFPFNLVRSPQQVNVDELMPYLAGDNPLTNDTISKYLSLTATQYFLIQQWVNGESGGTAPMPAPGAALDQGVLENCVGGPFCPGIEMTWISRNPTIYSEPFRIRHAMVEGPLSPTWGADNDYSQGMQPGDVTKFMAQPWQADFNQCSDQDITTDPNSNVNSGPSETYWWWPAQRPWYVYPMEEPVVQVAWDRGFEPDTASSTGTPNSPNLGDMQMVEDWKYLGFIFETQVGTFQRFVEIERQTAEIEAYVPPLIQPAATPSGKPE